MSKIIDSIVKVQTSIESTGANSANFGELLFVSTFSPFDTTIAFQGNEERHRKYYSLDDIKTDGWDVGSDVYQAGKAFFLLPINAGTFVLGRRDSADADYTATMEAINEEYSGYYGVVVNYDATTMDTSATYKQAIYDVATFVELNDKLCGIATADSACINKEIKPSNGGVVSGFTAETSLWTEVTAGSLDVTVDGGTKTTITAMDFSGVTDVASIASILGTAISGVSCSVVSNKIKFLSDATGLTSSVELAEGATGTSIYSLLNMAYSNEIVSAVQGWIPNGTSGVDGNADMFTFLSGFSEITRTFAYYNPNEIDGQQITSEDCEWLIVGAFSDGFSYDPASQTWAYKTITGVTPTDVKPSVLQFISNDEVPRYGNIYTSVKGVDITYHGRTADNTPIDVKRGIDWLDDLIQTNLFTLLTRQIDGQRKIPATDAGIASIEAILLETLGTASENFLDGDTVVVTVPSIDDTEATDREDRILKDIKWSARLQGAYENIEINGSLSN